MTQLLSFEPEGMFRPALLFVSYFLALTSISITDAKFGLHV